MKKTLKNMLIVLIAISMLFLLVGCGNKENNTATNTNNEENGQAPEEQKVEFSMGEWKDNVYTNNFLGLKFNLPEGWTYSSDEEIADMMNLGVEILNDDEKAATEIAKLAAAYYMFATEQNTGNMVTIVSEKPVIDMTTEAYIERLKNQLLGLENLNYKVVGVSKEKIANTECDSLTVNVDTNGVAVTQKYCVYKIDKYIVSITITSRTGDAKIGEIISCFE